MAARISEYRIAAGANVDIATGLPEGYRIGMAYALHGMVTVEGTDLAYMAPVDLNMDTVYISYYEGWQLRGFTEYRMINEALVMSGDADGDGKVNISDVTTLIDYLLSGNTSVINLVGADCNQDSLVNISDVTALIDYLLSGTWN